MNPPTPLSAALTTRQMAAFAGPSVLLFLYRAASYMLPALYAARFKFDLADLATILFTLRMIELALQLPAGMVSDAIRHPRWGRKPAVFICIVLGGLATFMLYRPPADATLVYFGVWIALATLAGSLAEVAYGAWATEITSEYRERGRCATFQAWASIVGKELFSIVPLLWFVSSKRMSFESLGVLGWILVGLVPLIVAWSWFGAPAGQAAVRTERVRWRQVWDIVRHNRPLHVVLVISLFWELGSGLFFGLDFMRIDSYLHAGQAVPYQGLLGVWAGAAGLALFQWLVRRHDKHRLWALSMVGLALSWLPQLLLSPGQPGLVPILVGFTLLMYFFAAGVVVVPMAIVGDLADYEGLRSGQRAAGPMVALLQLINKLSGGISAISLGVVSLFGFKPGQPTYGPIEGFGLLLFNLALPAVLLLVAAAVAWTRYPITQKRHRAIARALERRSRKAAAPELPAAPVAPA